MATDGSATSRKTAAGTGTSAGKKQTGSGGAAKKQSTSATNGSQRPARRTSAPRAEAPRRASAGKVAELAARQLLDLTGKESEGITGLKRTDEGWTVFVDVVELTRVPNTTDVLATYEVEVDSHGDLQGYRRVRRFVRGTAGGE